MRVSWLLVATLALLSTLGEIRCPLALDGIACGHFRIQLRLTCCEKYRLKAALW